MPQRVSPTHFDTGPEGKRHSTRNKTSVREATVRVPDAAPRPRSSLVCSPLARCSSHTGLSDGPPTCHEHSCLRPLPLPFSPLFSGPLLPVSLYLLKCRLLRKASDDPASNSMPGPSLLFKFYFPPSEIDEVSLCLGTSSPPERKLREGTSLS